MLRKLTVRLLAGMAFVAIAVLGLAWWLLRASLPIIDGEMTMSGLAGRATIERDDHGIPTITASTREDLAFATGFAHAQDRLFQMDLLRRSAAGELAELVGEGAVEADRRVRFHRFRARARDVVAASTDEGRRILGRYAAGVNAGRQSLGARPFEYYILGTEPQDWTLEDSILVVYAMFLSLNESQAERDLQRGLAHRVLDPGVFAWLYPQGTSWDAPLMGEPRPTAPYPLAHEYSVSDRSIDAEPTRERGRPPFVGSNNWAVGGALTGTGRAMVANDMHLGLNVPNIFYQARLIQEGPAARDVTGVMLPGAPFVVAGSNGRIAWGYTNSYGDWVDAVVLRPGDAPNTYRTVDGDREFTTANEVIVVKDSEPVTLPVRETIWGPVAESVDYPDGEVAISWTAHHPVAVNLGLMRLERASSVAEALDIASTTGIPPQNFVTGDAGGNIGWTIAGKIPRRVGYDPNLPADWSDGAGWHGWLPAAEYPRVVNPESGRIWTANARVVDGAALEVVGNGGYDLSARSRQIRDGLFAKDTFTPDDMLAIQTDDRALFLSRWREFLLSVLTDAVVAEAPGLAEYRRLVDEWIPRASPESVGYRLVRGFRYELRWLVFNGLVEPVRAAYDEPVELRISNQFEAPLWQLLEARPAHLLPANFESWDALILAAVRRQVEWLETGFEGPLADRNWGELNTVVIRHPLSRALPALSRWLDMPRLPLNGDSNLPKAQGTGFGASERFAVSPGDESGGIMHMPAGQSGHPLSEFYKKGHEDWVRGRRSPFLPGETVHTLKLLPETR